MIDTVSILTDQLIKIWTGIVTMIPNAVISLVLLLITRLLSNSAQGIATKMMARTRLGANLRGLIETMVRLAIWFLGIMLAASIMLPGVTPASIIAGLGVTTVVIGFAFKDIFENFLAGVIMMLRDKMRIGDTISFTGIQGKIEHISLRETLVRRAGDELIIVPNSVLFKNPVEVFTNRQYRRHQMMLAVADDTKLEPLAESVATLVRAIDGVEETKDVRLLATDMKDNAIQLTLTWWTPARGADNPEIRDAIVRAIQPHLLANRVERDAAEVAA